MGVIQGESIGIGQLSRLSQNPIATLQHWDKAGILPARHKPHGRTTRRRYEMKDVYAACVCKTLSKYGFGWDSLKEVTRLIKTATDDEPNMDAA